MRILNGMVVGVLSAALLGGCASAISPAGRKLLLAADAAYQRGDDHRAIQEASRFLAIHPRIQEAGEAYYIRGLARIRSGQLEEGKADLAEALKLAKRKDLLALIYVKLGEVAYNADDLRQAEDQYRSALRYTPSGAPPADEAMYRLGCVLQRQGRWREADLFFDRVIYLFDGGELCRRAKLRVHATHWSIQAGAFLRPEAARSLQSRLGGESLVARIDREEREGRLTHLVRVGSYQRYEAARADLRRVRRIRPDAFVAAAK